MNHKSSVADFSEKLDELYNHFSNKLVFLMAAVKKKEQLIPEVLDDINLNKISKITYDNVMSKTEGRLTDVNNNLDDMKHLSGILDKFKNVSTRFEDLYKEQLNNYDKVSRALNNRYLNTGSKLTQLALAKLPENNAELEEAILDALDGLGEVDETKRANVVKNMMASVKDARKGRGGSKKRNYLKRNKTIRRSSKK